jgi:hypothetical protein
MDIALGVLLLVSSLMTPAVPFVQGGHVRTNDPDVRDLIAGGVQRSSIFRDLVARLGVSDVIVYIENDCSMPAFLFGRTNFMSSGGGMRYVMIGIACARVDRERVAILAHELQHAIEIAGSPSIVDQDSLAAQYRRIGFMSDGFTPGKGYDTRAAIDTGRRVWLELGQNGE